MSLGAEMSGRVKTRLAINHWRTAVFTHQTNLPDAQHICARIQDMDLYGDSELPERIDLLMAGIECVFHSNARGGAPIDDQRRSTAWRVLDWIGYYQPRICIFENVKEFTKWGPINKKTGRPIKKQAGKIFTAWVKSIEAMGYRVDWRVLNAADYGEATKRNRLFIVCKRGNRKIHWPEPTHCKEASNGRKPWRAAREVIDWSIPAPSIFSRKKPLADKTLRRIDIGLKKFVEPFLVDIHNGSGTDRSSSLHGPTRTIVGKDGQSLVVPYVTHYHSGQDVDRATRNGSVDDPLGTLDTSNRYGLVQPQLPFLTVAQGPGYNDDGFDGVHSPDEPHRTITSKGPNYKGTGTANGTDEPLGTVQAEGRHYGVAQPAFMVPHYSGGNDTTDMNGPMPTITAKREGQIAIPFLADVNHGGSDASRVKDIDTPFGTITTKHGKSLVFAFLTQYYGTGKVASIDDALTTITAKHRHGLAVIHTMERLGVVDIGFRMLSVGELKAAQGFPADYELHGTKADQVRQVGNSVCPRVMAAICEAVC